MHEFSICQNLVDTVIETLNKNGQEKAVVNSVTVVVGSMRQIIPEYLQSAFEMLVSGTNLQSTKLEIIDSPASFKCIDCNRDTSTSAPPFVCPVCGSTNLESISGMELYLKSIEVEN